LEGLKGDEIPLGARIIAAADAYCAMIEMRPYRPPRGPAAARAELLAQSGSQFDADCARAGGKARVVSRERSAIHVRQGGRQQH
jgi:HD-GYP domain-containing protein (c-di-GMP phosphodiesterase class II)